MSLGKAIYDLVRVDSAVQAVFGTPVRIAEARIDTGVAAPFAVFDLFVDTMPVHSMDDRTLAASLLAEDRARSVSLEATVHSKTTDSAAALAQAQTLYTGLLGLNGDRDGLRFSGVRLESVDPPEWNSQLDRFETDFEMSFFVDRIRT